MATHLQRAHLKGLMKWLWDNRALIDYEQRRPMRLTDLTEQELASMFARGQHVRSDCSETVTALCKWAGLADPNGCDFNGTGYTGTMLRQLPHYSNPAAAEVGALVIYGPGAGDHVSMVYTPGADPMLFSHGQDADPRFVRLSTQRRSHRPPVTFLSVAKL